MDVAYNKWNKIVQDLDSDDSDNDEIKINEKNGDYEKGIIEQHLNDIADTKQRFNNSGNDNDNAQFIQSIIDIKAANHVCMTSLKDLKPISIWQLKPNTIHYGFKLIAKIITPPDKLLSFRTIIKDIDDKNNNYGHNVIQLSIYNLIPFQISLSQIEKLKILSKNTMIAIKEPYCKFYKSNKLGIRIDNPYYNLTIIDNNDSNNTDDTKDDSIESLKNAGNKYFKQKQYWKAISIYSKSLKMIDSETPIQSFNEVKLKLLLNKSLCYLKLNEYNLSYIDAKNAYNIDSKSIKVQYRYLSSLTNIGKHEQALSMINNLDFNQITSKSIKKEFIKLKHTIYRRYNESIGKYVKDSYKLMSDDNQWKLVENYIGNIDIKMINKTKGRGIIATKDIKCGQLILAEKAFSFGCYKNYNNDNDNCYIQTFNDQCKTAYSGRNQELILNTLSQCFPYDYTNYSNQNDEFPLYENSMQCILNKWRLLQLYDGNESNIKIPKENMIEMFRSNDLRELMEKNLDIERFKNAAISAKKVNDIILSNAFETLMNPEDIRYFMNDNDDGCNFDVIKNERYCGCGLWIIGSLFNHCNESNAERFIYYKMMFIKAKKDIKSGEEITISYIDQSISSNNDKQNELKNWGIN